MIENDSALFKVDIDNYSGPLDVLLDLAKAQKVNLENISITKLADQFHNFITKNKNLNLEIIEWNIKSTTKAMQGLYEHDAVRRLIDSQLGKKIEDISKYIK